LTIAPLNRNSIDIKDSTNVSADKDKTAWLKAVADDKLDWTQLCDFSGDNPVLKKYGIELWEP
jgi:hypothetical protein